jgi:hypothetical protein
LQAAASYIGVNIGALTVKVSTSLVANQNKLSQIAG